MKYKFISGDVRLILPRSFEIDAESLEEAEDLLVEHLKERGEVEQFSCALDRSVDAK